MTPDDLREMKIRSELRARTSPDDLVDPRRVYLISTLKFILRRLDKARDLIEELHTEQADRDV